MPNDNDVSIAMKGPNLHFEERGSAGFVAIGHDYDEGFHAEVLWYGDREDLTRLLQTMIAGGLREYGTDWLLDLVAGVEPLPPDSIDLAKH